MKQLFIAMLLMFGLQMTSFSQTANNVLIAPACAGCTYIWSNVVTDGVTDDSTAVSTTGLYTLTNEKTYAKFTDSLDRDSHIINPEKLMQSTKSSNTSSEYVGERGGVYHYTSSGKKSYYKKK